MMRIRPASVVLALALSARLASADPAFRATVREGALRVEIEGSYAGSTYTVSRALDAAGEYRPVSSTDALCTGQCYAYDLEVQPGGTYWYRFDLQPATGPPVRFGPYRATVPLPPPIAARVTPNPGAGAIRIDLALGGPAGAGVATELALFDLAGRRVAVLDRAVMSAGARSVTWNGRLADGRPAPAGSYLLRFRAADGRVFTTRLVRTR